MTRRVKLMTGLSTLAAASALALTGCGGEGEAGEGADNDADLSAVAAGEGESGASEGEGEGEGAAATDPASSDVAYMHVLGLVRGHLIAFTELYRGGVTDMAMTHVKHPKSELYASLLPAFEARGLDGFAEELSALAAAAEAGGDVEGPYREVVAAITANTPKASVAKQLLAVSEIVRTAADEFDIGVEDDGTVVNAHEYQDAYGFLIASREILSGIDTQDVNESDAIALAHEQIELALAPYNSLTDASTEGKASALYGAAARIEIAAHGLQ
ncbi:hypothetical protein [Hyphococcus luteus]|uniref:DUF305 domain-containing protein n=1 Tax=Hyphococcus luteus TaxID=2058213 RepID=A0A2S7JYQ6_9PROT|nr:hypothetical protein [Marinicaulis flavus]PQA85356.1 hypothetical protein CW354_20595 [Marinicaulis flavus]